ncbi:reverse transcriptase domain-containing protein [Chryseobacterium arachidis]|uniref:reverse transcriptase domain-containing protein n=1 Tax=Chryseobacterium arachidis TaxID=1416778 RepID=UPI00360FC8B7
MIRKAKGYKCFFKDVKELREEIKNGNLKVYKNPFTKKLDNGKVVKIGIPQGLPLSAVLANIYLLDFDRNIIKEIVRKYRGYYRRYSDDLLIICSSDDVDNIKQFVLTEILKYGLKISSHKTEEFLFENLVYNKNFDKRLTSVKIENNQRRIAKPLIYLGFEYRGFSTSIKSTNLSKYYRRLIYIVKRRAKRASKNITPESKKAIYKHQIKKLYNAPLKNIDSDSKELKQKFRMRYRFVKNELGEYDLEPVKMPIKKQSNYISYLKRCDRIFNRNKSNSFLKQVRKRKNILNHAIKKHLNKNF